MKKRIDLTDKTILVTGSPGFIGASLVLRLLREMEGGTVVSLDDLNDYYDPKIKEDRAALIQEAAQSAKARHIFVTGSLADKGLLDRVFRWYKPQIVVNLAGHDSVAYSVENPDSCVEANIIGFYNLLEACRHAGYVEHLIFASSSSVYGDPGSSSFRTGDSTDESLSLYAATKKADEILAHAYCRQYGIPTTGLRIFTVYGPLGRPDMFYYSAAKTLRDGGTVKLFNQGNCRRDFTYIDDAVEAILRVMQGAPAAESDAAGRSTAAYSVYNVGSGRATELLDFTDVLQEELVAAGVLPEDFDFAGHRELTGPRDGDVETACADPASLRRDFGYVPSTGIREGLRKFAQWFKEYEK